MDRRGPGTRAPLAIAAAAGLLLIAFASRYGYHRDELYFIEAGRHLDWAYADQGPITPLIARAMTAIAPDSLTVLRLPSAVAAATTVLVTGLIARELGAERRAQSLAAGCAALASIVLFTGHLLSTSTFDLLAWTVVTWLVVRAVRRREDRMWPIAGLVLGLGVLNKPLPAFLAAALLAGVAIAGPRELLRNRWVWLGAAIAVALSLPFVLWQASHGWPQIDVSREIAAGGSASSEPWWAVVPFQFLLVSPPLAPVWIAGLVRLFRDPGLRELRFLGIAWVVLAVVFMATGGKPYYLAGLLPVLIAAGAQPTVEWAGRGRRRARVALLAAVLVVSFAVDVTIALPVLPADRTGPVLAANGDVGETIGWPELVRTVAGVYRRTPGAVVLTGNYGEAGAIDRYGGAYGLPRAYSGHNAYGFWGPPPDGAAPVVVVGLSPGEMAAHLSGCRVVARIDNSDDVDNDERGEPVMVCDGPRRPWRQEWPRLRHLG